MIKSRKRKELIRKSIIYSGLILFALFVLVPFAIMVLSSLKHKEETIGSFTWWPKLGMTLKGYANAFGKVASSTSILEGFVNTLGSSFRPRCWACWCPRWLPMPLPKCVSGAKRSCSAF